MVAGRSFVVLIETSPWEDPASLTKLSLCRGFKSNCGESLYFDKLEKVLMKKDIIDRHFETYNMNESVSKAD